MFRKARVRVILIRKASVRKVLRPILDAAQDASVIDGGVVAGSNKMATALYIVIQSRGKWWVDHDGEAKGPYETRETAALEGRALAQMAGHNNRISEVIVPDSAGKYWVVWT